MNKTVEEQVKDFEVLVVGQKDTKVEQMVQEVPNVNLPIDY